MDKLKAFFIKYKLWIAGGAVAFIAFYLLRGSGGGGTGQAVSTSYTTSDGSTANSYTDPSLMIAQLNAQTQLAGQAAEFQNQLSLAQLSADNTAMQLTAERDINLATIDANKWVAQLEANTQTALGDLNYQTTLANNAFQLNMAQNSALVSQNELEANKFIAGLNSAAQIKAAQLNANAAQYQAKVAKRGQDYAFAGSVLNTLGSYFSK